MKTLRNILLAAAVLSPFAVTPSQAALCPTTLAMKNCWFVLGEVVLPNNLNTPPWTFGNVFTYPDPTGGYTTQAEAVSLSNELLAVQAKNGEVHLVAYLGVFTSDAAFATAVKAQANCDHFTDPGCPGGRYYTGVIYKPHT
jgi:hypothetical protein